MMPPRFLLCVTLALASCHRGPAPLPDLFTESVGPWHRTSAGELLPSAPPDPVPPAAIERIRAASYEGPGKLKARAYQLTSAAAACTQPCCSGVNDCHTLSLHHSRLQFASCPVSDMIGATS